MSLELTDSLKALFPTTANRLKGSDRRQFMAQVGQELGSGSAAKAAPELAWGCTFAGGSCPHSCRWFWALKYTMKINLPGQFSGR